MNLGLLILGFICRIVLGEKIAVWLFCRPSKKTEGKITLDDFFEQLGEVGAQAFRFS